MCLQGGCIQELNYYLSPWSFDVQCIEPYIIWKPQLHDFYKHFVESNQQMSLTNDYSGLNFIIKSSPWEFRYFFNFSNKSVAWMLLAALLNIIQWKLVLNSWAWNQESNKTQSLKDTALLTQHCIALMGPPKINFVPILAYRQSLNNTSLCSLRPNIHKTN